MGLFGIFKKSGGTKTPEKMDFEFFRMDPDNEDIGFGYAYDSFCLPAHRPYRYLAGNRVSFANEPLSQSPSHFVNNELYIFKTVGSDKLNRFVKQFRSNVMDLDGKYVVMYTHRIVTLTRKQNSDGHAEVCDTEDDVIKYLSSEDRALFSLALKDFNKYLEQKNR